MLCNSWIVVDRETGKAILETWSQKVVLAINTAKYEVLTAHAYLVRLNKQIAKGD